jgi:cellulose synthase/poly-beta-1,6-N-acetylglucosamine synthase-like glycosyltransferase
MIMDTVAAAAVQQYPSKRFQVFVLDDAADGNLRKAIEDFNSSNRARRSEYQDVVYFARKKPVGQRHYYKSGNIRSGLAFTVSNYGSSEYFAALDSDMISEPDWLARTVPHLIKDENVALVSPPHNYYNILQKDDLGQDGSAFSQISEPSRGFFDCSQCAGSGYIMRRRALDTIGGWPLANVGEDIICSTMLQEQGWKTQFIPDQLQFGLVPDSFHSYINQRIRWVSHLSQNVHQSCCFTTNHATYRRTAASCSETGSPFLSAD